MICGDFNLIYHVEDKKNGNVNQRLMGKFRRYINNLALKEIYLNGRRYTWLNKQNPLTLPGSCPLQLGVGRPPRRMPPSISCLDGLTPQSTSARLQPGDAYLLEFRFEELWLDSFNNVVTEAWNSIEHADHFHRIWLRL